MGILKILYHLKDFTKRKSMKIALPTQFHTQITSTLKLVENGLTKKIVIKVVNRNISTVKSPKQKFSVDCEKCNNFGDFGVI